MIFISGFFYVGFIVYLSKPSLPNLNATAQQQFNVDLKPKFLAYHPENLFFSKSDSNVNYQQAGRYLDFEVDGKVVYMLSNKDAPKTVTIAYYKIQEETLTFYLSELIGDGDKIYESDKRALPGHLGISDIVKGHDGKYLYKRKQDSRLFRIFDNRTSLLGPTFADFPGRLLAFAYLFSPANVPTAFAAQYLPTPNSKLFEVSFSVYTLEESKSTWSRQLLWSVQLIGLGENMIDADQVDYLYFLTKALIATKSDGKMVAFVFMEHLFTVLLNSENKWELNTQPIIGLHGADYDVDLILSTTAKKDLVTNAENTVNKNDSEENLIIIVAEENRCFVFSDKRMAEMGLFARLRGQLGVYNDLILFFLQEIFHLWLFPEDILELSTTSLPTSLLDSNAQSNSSWNILGMWSSELNNLDNVSLPT